MDIIVMIILGMAAIILILLLDKLDGTVPDAVLGCMAITMVFLIATDAVLLGIKVAKVTGVF